ncbi:MAG: hypothetical protein AAGA29_12670 [Planctomycetota bacterium]
MSNDLQRILAEISRHGNAGKVRAQHDSARLRGPNPNPRVTNERDFARVIGAFVNRQLEATGGRRYPDFEARAVAKEMLVQHGRRVNKTYNNFVRDAIDGHDGGLRGVLDFLTDLLREQQAERYRSDAKDRHIDPLSFDQKKKITGDILAHYRSADPSSVPDPRPEVYAHDYSALLDEMARKQDDMTDKLRGH